jgi:hypothetical protein
LRLFLTSMAINLGNPEVIVFFLALLATVVNLVSLTPLGFAELTTLVAIIAWTVLTGYAATAALCASRFYLAGSVAGASGAVGEWNSPGSRRENAAESPSTVATAAASIRRWSGRAPAPSRCR